MKHRSIRILSAIMTSCMIVTMFPAYVGAEPVTNELNADIETAELTDIAEEFAFTDGTVNEIDPDKAAIDKPCPRKVIYDNTGNQPKVQCEYEDKEGNKWIEVYLIGNEAKEGDVKGPFGLIEIDGKMYHLKSFPTTINSNNKDKYYKDSKTGLWVVKDEMYMGEEKKPAPEEKIGFVIETGSSDSDRKFSEPVWLDVPAEGKSVEIKPGEEEEKIAMVPEGRSLTYNGEEQTGVEAGTGYTLSGTVKAKDAGKYQAKAELDKGYKWSDGKTEATRTVDWEIKKAEISDVQFKKDTLTYNGKNQYPKITSVVAEGSDKDNPVKVPKGEYTVEKPKTSKNVGKYKITVKANSKNFKGKAVEGYKIDPKYNEVFGKVSIKKAEGGKKSIKVSWKKLSKEKQGKIQKIEIQYSTNKSFKNAKSKMIKSSKTSRTISGLKAGKKYYVRIRAYTDKGNTIEVSKWSAKKTVKTLK